MPQTRKCPVKGCPGRVEITTSGNGGIVESCPCCERRALWQLAHLPQFTRVLCVICGGGFLVQARAAARAKYCPACRPIAHQASVTDWQRKRKHRTPCATSTPER